VLVPPSVSDTTTTSASAAAVPRCETHMIHSVMFVRRSSSGNNSNSKDGSSGSKAGDGSWCQHQLTSRVRDACFWSGSSSAATTNAVRDNNSRAAGTKSGVLAIAEDGRTLVTLTLGTGQVTRVLRVSSCFELEHIWGSPRGGSASVALSVSYVLCSMFHGIPSLFCLCLSLSIYYRLPAFSDTT
jgi:hypothetical protein